MIIMSIKSCFFVLVAKMNFHWSLGPKTNAFKFGIGFLVENRMSACVSACVCVCNSFAQILKTICLVEIKCELNCIAIYPWISHLHKHFKTLNSIELNTILYIRCRRGPKHIHSRKLFTMWSPYIMTSDLSCFLLLLTSCKSTITWKLHLPFSTIKAHSKYM